jgi:hypothetical protein
MTYPANPYRLSSSNAGNAPVLSSGGPWRIFKPAFCVLLFIASFYLSNHVLSIYTAGDQIYYTRFYNALSYAPIQSIPSLQLAHIGNSDPLFGIIMWVGARLFEKNAYVSFFNGILSVLLFLYLSRNKVPVWVYPLFFTNFYFIVIATSAERLKFSIIFVLLFLLIKSRSRYLAAAASIFIHLQNVILYVSVIFKDLAKYIYGALRSGRLDMKQAAVVVGSVLVIGFLVYSSIDVIVLKLSYYQSLLIEESLSLIMLLTITLIVVRDKGDALLSMIPIIIASYILGGSRVNMIGVMVFIYFVVRDRRCSHPVFLLTMGYFSYKSIGYVESMYMYGDGFVGLLTGL